MSLKPKQNKTKPKLTVYLVSQVHVEFVSRHITTEKNENRGMSVIDWFSLITQPLNLTYWNSPSWIKENNVHFLQKTKSTYHELSDLLTSFKTVVWPIRFSTFTPPDVFSQCLLISWKPSCNNSFRCRQNFTHKGVPLFRFQRTSM